MLEFASTLYCLVNDTSSDPSLDPCLEPLSFDFDIALTEPSPSLDFFRLDFLGMLGRLCELEDSPTRGLVISFCLWRLLEDLDLWLGLPSGESVDPMLSIDGCRLDDFGKPGKSLAGESLTEVFLLVDESIKFKIKPDNQIHLLAFVPLN